jgi:hypothetical protein
MKGVVENRGVGGAARKRLAHATHLVSKVFEEVAQLLRESWSRRKFTTAGRHLPGDQDVDLTSRTLVSTARRVSRPLEAARESARESPPVRTRRRGL